MNISLMTLSMFVRIFYRFYMYKDMEDSKELYEEMMDYTKEAGFNTIELTSRETSLFGTAYIKDVLDKRNIKVGGYMHMDNLDEPKENLEKALEIAKAFAADTLMLIPYWHPTLENKTRDEIHQIYADRWELVSNKASLSGIKCVIEDTPDQRLHLCKSEDVLHFLSLLPKMSFLYDTGNMILALEEPLSYYQKMKEYISYVHIKDMKRVPKNTRGADIDLNNETFASARHGDGLINFKPLIKEIKNDYKGRIVIELSMDNSDSYLEAINYAKKYVEELLSDN